MSSLALTMEEQLRELRREAEKARERHPDRLPIMAEPGKRSLPALDRPWLLVSADLPISQLSKLIKRRLDLGRESVLKLEAVNNTSGSVVALEGGHVADHYAFHHDQDLFLHIRYSIR
jgi:hypothetical protein